MQSEKVSWESDAANAARKADDRLYSWAFQQATWGSRFPCAHQREGHNVNNVKCVGRRLVEVIVFGLVTETRESLGGEFAGFDSERRGPKRHPVFFFLCRPQGENHSLVDILEFSLFSAL